MTGRPAGVGVEIHYLLVIEFHVSSRSDCKHLCAFLNLVFSLVLLLILTCWQDHLEKKKTKQLTMLCLSRIIWKRWLPRGHVYHVPLDEMFESVNPLYKTGGLTSQFAKREHLLSSREINSLFVRLLACFNLKLI